MKDNWIKLYRQILDSEVFANPIALKIWIWCLLSANHKKKSVPISTGRGETIVNCDKGQFIFGRFKAEEQLNISGSTIYRWMEKFSSEKMGMLALETDSHYTVVTVLNWASYQGETTHHRTSNEQAMVKQRKSNGQPTDTTKNDKNEKNVKNSNANFSFLSREEKCKISYEAWITEQPERRKYTNYEKYKETFPA